MVGIFQNEPGLLGDNGNGKDYETLEPMKLFISNLLTSREQAEYEKGKEEGYAFVRFVIVKNKPTSFSIVFYGRQ